MHLRCPLSFWRLFPGLLGLTLLWAGGCNRRPDHLPQADLREELRAIAGLDLFSETGRQGAVQELRGLLEDHREETMVLLGELGPQWMHLADLLASTALDGLRKGRPEEANGLLELGLRLQPHHALCNGVKGIERAMQGHYGEARAYLEKADAWQLANPWIDHALGSLLLQSPRSADKARGKWLLKRVVASGHKDLAPAAALLMLTAPGLPIMGLEPTTWLDALEESGLLRQMKPPQLRGLMQRVAPASLALSLRVGDTLWKHPEASSEDRLAVARGQLLVGNTGFAETVLRESPTIAGPTGGSLPALLYLAKGEAAACLEALATNPGQLSGADANIIYRHFLPRAQLPISEEAALLEHGLLHEPLDSPLRFVLLSRLVSLNPLQGDRWARHAIKTWGPEEPLETARWLASVGRETSALALLEALDDDRALLALAEIHLSKGHTGPAQEALSTYKGLAKRSSSLAGWHLLMARCTTLGGEASAARGHWDAARKEALATGDYATFKNLGVLALECGWPDQARESLQLAYDAGVEMSVPQLVLLQDLTLQGHGAAPAIRIASSLRLREPDNGEFLNALAYLSFLTGKGAEPLLEDLRSLVQRDPDVVSYRLTLAFGLLQSGRPIEALRLLEQGHLDWQRLGNRSRLVYALVLQGADERVLAAGLAASVQRDRLIAEELGLLEGI